MFIYLGRKCKIWALRAYTKNKLRRVSECFWSWLVFGAEPKIGPVISFTYRNGFLSFLEIFAYSLHCKLTLINGFTLFPKITIKNSFFSDVLITLTIWNLTWLPWHKNNFLYFSRKFVTRTFVTCIMISVEFIFWLWT